MNGSGAIAVPFEQAPIIHPKRRPKDTAEPVARELAPAGLRSSPKTIQPDSLYDYRLNRSTNEY